MRINIQTILPVIFCLFLAVPSNTSAQNKPETSNITVRPFLQEIILKPGEATKQFKLTINNDSSFKQVFSLSAVNFGSLNETGGLVFEGASAKKISSKYGLAKWLKLDRSSIELEAGKQAEIEITINNDTQMAPGAHYAAIITTAQKPIQAIDQLNITPKVSSLVFVTKQGGDFYNIHLSSANHNGSFWNIPTVMSLRIQSTGNTYIVPRGIVTMMQGSQVISRGVINNQSAIVLPEVIRNFDVPLTQLRSFDRGWLLTDYKVRVEYRYDGISNFASKTYSYKVINKTPAVIFLLFVLAFVAAAIYAWRSGRLPGAVRNVKIRIKANSKPDN